MEDRQAKLKAIRQLFDELPASHRHLLVYLFTFLKKVSLRSDRNKMTVENLAVCWAPNLLRSKEELMEKALEDATQVAEVVALLIEVCRVFVLLTEQEIQYLSLDQTELMLNQIKQTYQAEVENLKSEVAQLREQSESTSNIDHTEIIERLKQRERKYKEKRLEWSGRDLII